MIITARGQLQHHFWGDYCATIRLGFASRQEAELARPLLQAAELQDIRMWQLGTMGAPTLRIFVDADQLEIVEKVLVSFGADPDAIGSTAHSIDYGDPFSIAIQVEDPAQMHLDLT